MKTHKGPGWAVLEGKALAHLTRLPDDRFHSVVQDPPSGIGFMNSKWDRDRGGRAGWVGWLTGIQEETLRVTRPGGWSLTWALPRRSHWTALALEDAGWEIRDIVHHMFGRGMPKGFLKDPRYKHVGTGLKPVAEHWILARKPLSESSTADNLERWLTGALMVDACRVGSNEGWSYPHGKGGSPLHGGGFKDIACAATKGRYPPHLVLGHGPGCRVTGTKQVKTGKAHRSNSGGNSFGGDRPKKTQVDMTYADQDGNEVVPVFVCVPGCPIAMIDKQAGGEKTRFWPQFLYCPKPSVREKNDGCQDLDPREWREGAKQSTPRSGQLYEHVGRLGKPRPNNHPTVKPVKLMRWLIRLVTHPGGIVLDPFSGSGTTGVAAVAEGMRYLGIEQEPYYCTVSARRIEAQRRRVCGTAKRGDG